jgi:prepilin-type N-terminal cleavage/methylation domain-containing protein
MGLEGKKGFTLIEILIVIVILAILAGLAIPIYGAAVEKSRSQEAIRGLETVRGAMLRYFAANNTFQFATIRAPGVAVSPTDIDADPNNPLGGQNRFFVYTLNGLSPVGFRATATRVVGTINGIAVPPGGPHTILITEDGAVTRSAPPEIDPDHLSEEKHHESVFNSKFTCSARTGMYVSTRHSSVRQFADDRGDPSRFLCDDGECRRGISQTLAAFAA